MFGHTASIISEHNEIVIFGGTDKVAYYNETYLFTPELLEWKRLETVGMPPKPRAFHAATIIDSNLYVFGGKCDNEIIGDLCVLHLGKLRQIDYIARYLFLELCYRNR